MIKVGQHGKDDSSTGKQTEEKTPSNNGSEILSKSDFRVKSNACSH